MGGYISNNHRNNSNSNNNNSERKKPNPPNNLASYFFIGGKKFEVILDQCQPFLFGDKSDLSFIYTNKPVKYPYPTTTLNSVTNVLKCLVNIRKDSLKLVKCEENDEQSGFNKYNIEFRFDCDIDVKIEVFYFVKEKFVNGVLNYSSAISHSPFFKSQVYKVGSNIPFQQSEHVIIPSKHNCLNWQYDQVNHIYPIVILCTPADAQNSTHAHATYASLEKMNDTDNYSIKLLKQKQAIDGICYSLQEIYGIEKKPVENSITNSEISIPNSKPASNSNSLSRKNSEKYTKTRRDSSIDLHQGVIECVICMCEKRDTLILPCRHLCLCKSCANNLRGQSNNCPICRVPFNALLQMELLKSPTNQQQVVKTITDVKETILEEQTNQSTTVAVVDSSSNFSNLNMYLINDNKNDTGSMNGSQYYATPLSSQEDVNDLDLKISTNRSLSHKNSNASKKSFNNNVKLDKKILWNNNNNNNNNNDDDEEELEQENDDQDSSDDITKKTRNLMHSIN